MHKMIFQEHSTLDRPSRGSIDHEQPRLNQFPSENQYQEFSLKRLNKVHSKSLVEGTLERSSTSGRPFPKGFEASKDLLSKVSEFLQSHLYKSRRLY